MNNKILALIKSSLGQHLTLDPTVPEDVGCAEAVSKILQEAGVQGIPQKGFAGTNDLWQWLKTNRQFVEATQPYPGSIIISPTGTSVKGTPHGHVGIIGLYGVCSNDSGTGLWKENYTVDSWESYFGNLGFPIYFYSPIC